MESGIYAITDGRGLKRVDVVFGGKIGVGVGRNKKDCGIALAELPTKQEIDTLQEKVSSFRIELLFDNVKSIDVMMKALQEVRERLTVKQ